MKTRKNTQRKAKKGGMLPTRKKIKLPHPNYIKFYERRKEATGYNQFANKSLPNNRSFFNINKNSGFAPNQPKQKKQKKNE
jgi:hypothetical protein